MSKMAPIVFATLTALAPLAAEPGPPGRGALDPSVIGDAAGTEATVAEDGVVRIGWSREVPVVVDGFPLDPAAGLGSWAGFTALPDGGALVMGDTVVFQDEVDAAMDAAFAAGLEVTALHNHMVGGEPVFYFTHYWGKGPAADLARSVRAALDAQDAAR